MDAADFRTRSEPLFLSEPGLAVLHAEEQAWAHTFRTILFPACWGCLPEEVRQTLLAHWRTHSLTVALRHTIPEDKTGLRVAHAHHHMNELVVAWPTLERIQARFINALLGHELAHFYLALVAPDRWQDEALIDQTVEGWGLPMHELRAWAGES